MKLGVNGIRLLGRRAGVGQAVSAILRSLDAVDHPFTEITVYSPTPLPGDLELPRGASNVVVPSGLPPGIWEQLRLPRVHGREGVLLCPSYLVPLWARSPTVVIHHGSYEGYPAAFPWLPRTKAQVAYALSAHRATMVSTVSEHSRLDMALHYRIDPARISVIPEGVDTTLFAPINDPHMLHMWRTSRLATDRPFIMYAGKPAPRRNLPALLEAWTMLVRDGSLDHDLVLFGTGLTGTNLQSAIEHTGFSERVHAVAYADHEELALAYNAADLLVYPSSYEGFGMPVLEAMACGTPVIALDNTAFPEFASGVAELLPDACPETLAQGIHAVLADPARRIRMGRLGPVRAAEYDWRVITKRYVELIVAAAGA